MLEDTEWEWEQLARQQLQLSFELTEWLLPRYPACSGAERVASDSSGAARLQLWVALLVRSLLESTRQAQPGLLSDFIVVLREREPVLFEPGLWRDALNRLGCRCHRLLKNSFQRRFLGHSTAPAPAAHSAARDCDAYQQQWERLADWLDRLDRALEAGQAEITATPATRNRLQPPGAAAGFYPGYARYWPPVSEFNLN